MKRSGRAWLGLWALGVGLAAVCGSFGADTGGKGARLEKLKGEFPAHVAGADLEKLHPVNRECFEEFHRRAMALTVDALAGDVVSLASSVENQKLLNDYAAKSQDNVFGSAGRTAARRNASWLNERVKPWLRKVALVAQGK